MPNKTYKFINMRLIRHAPKTEVYGIYNNRSGNLLGEIKWYGAWRSYCCHLKDAIFNIACLDDLKDFIQELKK